MMPYRVPGFSFFIVFFSVFLYISNSVAAKAANPYRGGELAMQTQLYMQTVFIILSERSAKYVWEKFAA